MLLILAFAIYISVLAGIGFWSYRNTKTDDDFTLGDRGINYFVTAIATQASDMGSWLFLGLPAAVYLHGMPEAWTAVGLTIGMYISWKWIAPRLRIESEQYNANTFVAYLNNRFDDKTNKIHLVGSCILLLFFSFYISAGLVGLGKLFEQAFGFTYLSSLGVGLAAVLVYTLAGGFVAVAWCDMFQGLLLLAMIVIVPVAALIKVGGWHAIATAATNQKISLSLFQSNGLFNSISLALSWGLGYFGQPHILTNFMGIDDVKKIKYARWVGISWQIMVLSSAVLSGLVALAYFGAPHISQVVFAEMTFVTMAKKLLPELLTGFVICGICAATLSSMDSQILISGSVITHDLLPRITGKNLHSQAAMQWTRASSALMSLLALLIAYHSSSSIYHLVNYAWSGLGSAFGPILLCALYAKRVTAQGALWGMIIGAVVSGLWPHLELPGLPLIPGFAASFCTIFLVSSFTKNIK